MKNKILTFHKRYKLDKLLDIDVSGYGGLREMFQYVLIGSNRLWVCDGVGLASVFVLNVPEDAKFTVLSKKQFKNAQKLKDKEGFVNLKYGLTGMNSKDEEVPFVSFYDGTRDEVLCFDKERVKGQIELYIKLLREYMNLKKLKQVSVSIAPNRFFNVLSALGAELSKESDNMFKYTYHVKHNKKAVAIRCGSYSGSESYYKNKCENGKHVARNIGLIMPMNLDSFKSE